MPKMRGAVILAARRTPIGRYGEAFRDIAAPHLLAPAIAKVLEDAGARSSHIDEVRVGHVLTAGLGQNPARQAALAAGLHESVPVSSVQKVCASSLLAISDIARGIWSDDIECGIAGGMESMSKAPFVHPRVFGIHGAYEGVFLTRGSSLTYDTMERDGLRDAYCGEHMGRLADVCAEAHSITREAQDEFAARSHERAIASREHSLFWNQLVPIGDVLEDGGVRVPDRAKMATLKPFFRHGGTITPANSSQLSDGAAALVIASRARARELGRTPLARIVATAAYAQHPRAYATAPAYAVGRVLQKAGLRIDDVDLFEINEAFAMVPLFATKVLNLDPEKVNIWGGAIALGHPIGASGARIVVTLVHALQQKRARYGIATACNGGGEAVAILIENLTNVKGDKS